MSLLPVKHRAWSWGLQIAGWSDALGAAGHLAYSSTAAQQLNKLLLPLSTRAHTHLLHAHSASGRSAQSSPRQHTWYAPGQKSHNTRGEKDAW